MECAEHGADVRAKGADRQFKDILGLINCIMKTAIINCKGRSHLKIKLYVPMFSWCNQRPSEKRDGQSLARGEWRRQPCVCDRMWCQHVHPLVNGFTGTLSVKLIRSPGSCFTMIQRTRPGHVLWEHPRHKRTLQKANTQYIFPQHIHPFPGTIWMELSYSEKSLY